MQSTMNDGKSTDAPESENVPRAIVFAGKSKGNMFMQFPVGEETQGENYAYGLHLSLLTHSKTIKTKADILVVWLHWCFLKNGFVNSGGEFTENICTSENLPANLGWNGDKCSYILRYLKIGLPFATCIKLDSKCEFVEISLVTLHRSMRVSIAIRDIVNEDFQLRDDTLQAMTELIDCSMVQPLIQFPV